VAHGTPDYGVTAGKVTTYQLKDLAELAARLESIVTFDRRGDVLFLEGFEQGVNKWAADLQGTGANWGQSNTRARSGQYSAALIAGSDGNHYANVEHDHAALVLSRFGIECSISLFSAISELWVGLIVTAQAAQSVFLIRWDDVNNALAVWTGAGVWTTFATSVDLGSTATLFQTFKLVIDAAARTYQRLILNDTTYDLTSYSAPAGAGSATHFITARVRLVGRVGQNDKVYVDDVIITQNEPANP